MTILSINVTRRSAYRLISLEGELDRLTQPSLAERLDEALSDLRPPAVVVDVTRLSFCDSSGLRALAQARDRAVAADGWLRLVGVNGPLALLLHVTGLIELLPTHDDVDQALRGVAAPPGPGRASGEDTATHRPAPPGV
ncbi:STAS domain-containing protein [Nonomuraea jiangxiensis]|uniref:Anti-sigma factor antagonist n=1 Tax=Nonomuraea jiangxiensis TaxID=633440 RepID=A0A1G9PBC7_9ACTN|nr:STAS domain-containing protein [Nonomuraea jiangxiensis]SDL96070.1 anti-sigma B factor antagonist [Nonomuraea jiangxiensis]